MTEEDQLTWIDMDVPFAPIPVRANQQNHLVYELFLHNSSNCHLDIKRLEVLPAESRFTADFDHPLHVFEGRELQDNLSVLEENLTHTVSEGLPAKKMACIFIWLSMDSIKPLPKRLIHRVYFNVTLEGIGKKQDITDGAPAAIMPQELPVFKAPLKGENWLVLNGPSNTSDHRRAMLPYAGQPYFPQRFGIDWLKIGRDGKFFSGDPARNENWHCYGQPVLAVTQSVVVNLADQFPENTPLGKTPAIPIKMDTAAGNFIVLQSENRTFITYAHLQPFTIKVRVGEIVKPGQVLGFLGNSGNSPMPHLHFHVGNSRSPLIAQGLPFILDHFIKSGAGKMPSTRQREMPLDNMVINFQ